MAIRQAPEKGYDFGSKRHYRRAVWKTLAAGLTDKSNVQILMLPSLEGDEIEVAMSHGFKQQNMHVVDKNPAIVATLKRRFPHINTYGVPLAEAAYRIRKRAGGPIQCANLDLCGPLTAGLVNELGHVAASECMSALSVVAVTVLRGREREAGVLLNDSRVLERIGQSRKHEPWATPKFTDLDVLRVDMPRVALECDGLYAAYPIRTEVYKSVAGHQTLMWTVYRLLAPAIDKALGEFAESVSAA